MKESISYTFLLNIIVTFIFICFAVIMGIFSYYRAFRANTAILNSIEKYEGFNCLSQQEAAKSLSNIGYTTPFRANRKTDNKGTLLTNNSEYDNLGYSVVYYDVGEPVVTYNAIKYYRQYQYGVFTYMYMDLPIVNQILKIPVFGKSSVMNEFRKFYYEESNGNIASAYFDIRLNITSNRNDVNSFSNRLLQDDNIKTFSAEVGAGNLVYSNIRSRVLYSIDSNGNGILEISDAVNSFDLHSNRECGIFIDYSAY